MSFKVILKVIVIILFTQSCKCKEAKVPLDSNLGKILLSFNEEKVIDVYADEYYSCNFIGVEKGQQYGFAMVSGPLWTDLLTKCDALGFHNRLLKECKKRVKKVNCFTLCGTINANEENNFPIGCGIAKFNITLSGNLHFFANDHCNRFFYRNNRGFVKVKIIRLK